MKFIHEEVGEARAMFHGIWVTAPWPFAKLRLYPDGLTIHLLGTGYSTPNEHVDFVTRKRYTPITGDGVRIERLSGQPVIFWSVNSGRLLDQFVELGVSVRDRDPGRPTGCPRPLVLSFRLPRFVLYFILAALILHWFGIAVGVFFYISQLRTFGLFDAIWLSVIGFIGLSIQPASLSSSIIRSV